MGRFRRGSQWLVATLVLTSRALGAEVPAPAKAEWPALELEWQAPSGCPGGEQVVGRVRELVAERGAVPTERLVVRVVVTASEQGFSAVLATEQNGAAGARSLHAESCTAVADGVALVVALALTPASPDSATAPEATASPPRPETKPAPAPVPPARVAKARANVQPLVQDDGAPRAGRWFVLGSALLDVGLIANAAGGVALGAGTRFGSIELSVRGTWLPSRRTHVAGTNKGGDFAMLGGGGGVCRLFSVTAEVTLAPCAGVDLSVVSASAFGTVDRNRPNVVSLSPAVSALARFRLTTAFALRFDAGAAVPLPRPRFFLENVGVVRQVPPVTGRFGVGFEATIP